MTAKKPRAAERFLVRDARTGVQLKTLLTMFKEARKGYLPVLDLSTRGCRYLAKEKLDPGTRLDLHIEVPATTQPIRVQGVVRWTRKKPNKNRWYTGVEFVKVKSDSLTIISKLESQLHLRRLGRDGDRPSV